MTARYAGYVLLLAAAAALLARLAGDGIPAAARPAVFLGLGLGAAGALSWILLTAWSIARGNQAFMAATMLGILARLVIYSATLIYVALRTSIDLLWMAGALLGFHLASTVLEVRYALVARRAGPDAGAGNAGRDDGR
ncbi:MAG TPA: hypothetical protein VFB49_13020 [Patescibacteria group bacterium]|nr:hypothetical protein [Patescibacteria group bacterium]